METIRTRSLVRLHIKKGGFDLFIRGKIKIPSEGISQPSKRHKIIKRIIERVQMRSTKKILKITKDGMVNKRRIFIGKKLKFFDP